MITLPDHFASTYTKMLLEEWTVIHDIIQEETIWIKDTLQQSTSESPLPSMLNNQQINDVFNGPFQHFFKSHLKAFAALSKIETALTISKEDFFKESEHGDKTLGIPESFLEHTEFSTLKELRNNLETITKKHHAQWKSEIQKWTEILLQKFKKNNINLSDLELQDFSLNQPLSEINDRFINLKIPEPKLPKSPFNFQHYFILKITMAAHSAFNRMQQSKTENEIIDTAVSAMQTSLKSIHQAEKTLIATQEKAVNELMLPMTFEN
ncbi:MAG: putative cytosolic protein [uncultured bacterium]|nr:MAG: putative cytosolic protein [uncultured bacterium]OGT33191.1 MAG: hypothetical protein A3C44_06380 [Gammaproteobacteria bacterium RIFCSPHIGHO2_02_FULL_39_13]OGT49226.1 MAG: hypothetical protein A3E53_07155 [Gammaproteobacteria bacterium RIFCSPHIGHO2_12_FULL_39_24]